MQPINTSSSTTAAMTTLAASVERGDPRMNRAVQLKLEDPMLPLADCLRKGGFHYPPQASGLTLDDEGVSLGQRKNQLNRRVRRATKEATPASPKRKAEDRAASKPQTQKAKKQKVEHMGESSVIATLRGQLPTVSFLPGPSSKPVRTESAVLSALRNTKKVQVGATTATCSKPTPSTPLSAATDPANPLLLSGAETYLIDYLSNCQPYGNAKSKKEHPSSKTAIQIPEPTPISEDPFMDEILQLPSIQNDEHEELYPYDDDIELLDAPLEANLPQTASSNRSIARSIVSLDDSFASSVATKTPEADPKLAKALTIFDKELRTSLFPTAMNKAGLPPSHNLNAFASRAWVQESQPLAGIFNTAF